MDNVDVRRGHLLPLPANGLRLLAELGTVGLGAVFLVGLPSVFIQYRALGISVTFVKFEDGLRAGAIPAVALGLLILYYNWATAGTSGVEGQVRLLPSWML